MLSSFRKIVAKDRDLQRVQENVALVFNQLLPKEILDGVIVSASVKDTSTVVNHTLGRQPQGWLLIDQEAATGGINGVIIRQAWDERSITLINNGTGIVPLTLWIF
jgi:hypothetical protein